MIILIVDDIEDSRILLTRNLERAGYTVITASNGAEALKKARDSSPDIIVSDILMPEMDGFRFCREVKKDEALCSIPFIFYTATYTDPQDEKLAASLGASRFIIKPVDNEEFLKIIQDVLNEYKGQRASVPAGAPQDDTSVMKLYEERIESKLDEKIRALERERKALQQMEAELHASEEKYRSIFDNVNDAIFINDIEDARILEVNQKMCEMFDYTRDEALHLKVEDLSAADPATTQETARAYIENTINQGPQVFQWLCKNKSGKLFWVEVNLKLINLDAKDRIVAVVRDISAQKQAEASLMESEERFRTIFENSPVGISIANPDGLLVDSNPAFQKMLGYTKEELTIKFSDITYPDDIKENMHLLQEMVEGKRDHYQMEKRYFHKNGSLVWANLIVTAIRDRDGMFKYNFAIIENITERKKLEDQLRHAQKLEAIGQLAGGVAHDFNNILTAIIGYGSILKMQLKGNEKQMHNIKQILAITERGAGLTQSLLAFSRKQAISLKPVKLNALIDRIGRLIPRLIGEEIEFRKILVEEEMTIMGDSGQIEQVLMNLASNARDAMPRGGVLTVRTERLDMDTEYVKIHGFGAKGPYAVMSVSDQGSGIDPAIIDKIFEPFFTTKVVGEGTGLGLSLVYGIIKQHDGYINVYSELGKGTTFKIHLPLVRESEVELERPASDAVTVGGKETILLAEDEDSVRGAIKGILQEYGFTVIETVDGEDAVAKYAENQDRIHLLLLDVVMPKMNGKEAYDKIRQINPKIRAIFTSGYTTKTIQAKGVLIQGVHFLPKPVQPRDLLRKIREVLNES